MGTVLAVVAAALQRPAEELVELDRRPLQLAFMPGNFLTVTVRDRATRAVHDVTVEPDTGERVDAAALRRRDRAAGTALTALAPDLLAVMLRHPRLTGLRVTVTSASGRRTVEASVEQVADLARQADVTRVALVADPEVTDHAAAED